MKDIGAIEAMVVAVLHYWQRRQTIIVISWRYAYNSAAATLIIKAFISLI